MELDKDKLNQVIRDLYVARIQLAYGDIGSQVLQNMLEAIGKIYAHISPELISGDLIVFQTLTTDKEISFAKPATELLNFSHLTQEDIFKTQTCVIQIHESGTLSLWKNFCPNINDLSINALVYQYSNKNDIFIIKGSASSVPKLCPGFASMFSTPAFSNLEEALEDYKRTMVKHSSCQIFTLVWHGGMQSDRIFFKNKPEATMRDSLAQYLQNVLRGADVTREHIVDSSHPVDIKVTWYFTRKTALIEIKWLGKTITKKGALTSYEDARARAGAKQLIDYIDAKYKSTPLQEIVGYLVVIDGRRKNITDANIRAISYTDGLWYKDQEITYNPEYHKFRSDFHEPIRMFAEPKCQPD